MKRKTISLDSNGDIAVENNNLVFVEGREAYAQIVSSTIRTQQRELVYDIERGVPYLETIFRNPSYLGFYKNDVKKLIKSLDFVKDISSFDIKVDYSKHNITYSMTINTDEGIIPITVNQQQ